MNYKQPVISFEFFPPKSPEGQHRLLLEAEQLAQTKPLFFSVTFGAGGSTRDGTLQTVSHLQQRITSLIAPHLSCIGATKEEIVDMLRCYQSMGVRRLVALRGDLPSGMGQAGAFKYASELVQLIREETGDFFHVDVAAYPEIHPQALNAHDDVLNLKRKEEAGASGAITQYFFNADAYFYYLDECARAGIDIPVTPGIMPIMQFSKLARFSDSCGAEIPRWIRKRLESYGDDLASVQAFGLEVVARLCHQLLEGGAPGLHFYTLNHAEKSLQLLDALSLSSVTALCA